MRSWKRRLSDDEWSVLLAELLLRHPGLAAEAEEISSALLVVDDQEIIDEIAARLRALRLRGPVYKKVGPLHLSLPPLAEECPEWAWYEEN